MKKLLSIIFIITILVSIESSVLAITASITTDELNVREAPSTEANSIGVLNNGEKVEIISTEGDWYKIKYEGKEGYINKNYTKEENDEQKQENTNDNKEDSVNEDLTLNTDTELYSLPLLNSVKYTTIPKGTKIKMISNNGKWLYIHTDKESGWIISSKTSAQAKQGREKQNNTQNNETNTMTNSVTDALENTTQENIVANTISENEKTDITNNGEYPVVMYVTTDSVNVRSEPNASSSVISGAVEGSDLEVLGKEGDWYKVNTEDGIGYIKSDFLSKNR